MKTLASILLSLFFLPSALQAQEEKKPEKKKEAQQEQKEAAPKAEQIEAISPEELLNSVRKDLLNLKSKIKSFDRIYQSDGLGPSNELARAALSNAKEDFKKIEYRSTVRNLNNFLNWTQVPKIEDYLDAQYMLGKSHSALKNRKMAVLAYSRYLSTLSTNPEHFNSRAIKVIKNILSLFENARRGVGIELGALMSALTSMEVPKAQKAFIHFYAGKSARLAKNDKVALYWLDKTILETKLEHLKSRAHYNRGLIYLRQKNYQKAVFELQKALSGTKDTNRDYRDWAKLAMARVYVHLRKPNKAKSYYKDIHEDAPAFKEALYEKVYLLLSQNLPKEAIYAASDYLKRYPKAKDSHHLRTLKAYLELRADNLEAATKTIEESTKNLLDLSQWLKDNYAKRDTLVQRDISGIIKKTDPEISHPPLILQGRRVYQKIGETNHRLRDLRSDMRHTIFTMGRINTEALKPKWQNRTDQLMLLLENLLASADKLILSEARLYKNRLAPKDKQILSSSYERRKRGLSSTAKFASKKGPWQTWAALGDLHIRAAKRFKQIKNLQAELASLTLIAKTNKIRRPKARLSEIIELRHQSDELEAMLLRAIEITRNMQAQTAVFMSDLTPLKIIFKSQAESIFLEKSVLKSHRDQFHKAKEVHISEDLNEAWSLWEHVLETLYAQVLLVEKDMTKTVAKRIRELESLIATHDAILGELKLEAEKLSRSLGRNLHQILGHYQAQIEERNSKHAKWLADIKWLTFERTQKEKEGFLEKHRLEEQILNDNLKNLEQGVLWQWPQENM